MIKVGGNALINGIKLYGDEFAVKAVRKSDEIIYVETKPTKSSSVRNRLNQVPFIRGLLFLWISIPLLSLALVAFKKNPTSIIFLAILVSISVFTLIYMRYKKYNRLGYRGAEHKVISAYQNKKVLNISTVAAESRLHVSCGSMYIFHLTILIGIFYFTTQGSPVLTTVLALGFAYEIHRIKSPSKISVLCLYYKAGLFCQKAATIEPTKEQIEVSIRCMNELILREKEYYEITNRQLKSI